MADSFIYLYTATFFDPDGAELTECGLLYATSYKDALAQIGLQYGDDLIHLDITIKDAYAPFTFDPSHLPYITALIKEE